MNVLFLVPNLDGPSTRHRVLQYRPLLENQGINSAVSVAPRTLRGKIETWRILSKFEALFIQKRLFQPWESWIMRLLSRRLVYDLDDAVMFKDNGTDKGLIPSRKIKFRSLARVCDLVIAGNNYLKERVLPLNSRVELLPTPVDMTRYCPKIYREKNRITIGWIGSRSTFSYLGWIKGVLEKIGERYQNVELKIVADKFFDCKNIPVVKSKWSYDSEIDDLHSFDIGLMPLPDNAWTRGKCGFKLIQCMAVQVPVICSPVGMNREIVQHGANGLWANNSEEWIKGLSTLIETPTMREELGVNGRKTVQEKYSLELNAMRLAGLLKNCIQGTNHADDQD